MICIVQACERQLFRTLKTCFNDLKTLSLQILTWLRVFRKNSTSGCANARFHVSTYALLPTQDGSNCFFEKLLNPLRDMMTTTRVRTQNMTKPDERKNFKFKKFRKFRNFEKFKYFRKKLICNV